MVSLEYLPAALVSSYLGQEDGGALAEIPCLLFGDVDQFGDVGSEMGEYCWGEFWVITPDPEEVAAVAEQDLVLGVDKVEYGV